MQVQSLVYPDGSQQTFYNPVESWVRTLSCGPIVKGDFKNANPWNYNWSLASHLEGREVARSPSQTVINTGVIGSVSVSHPDTSAYIAVAMDKALNRLNEKTRGSLDLAVSLAESGQTVKMLSLVSRYTVAITNMRRTYLTQVWDKFNGNKRSRRLPQLLRKWQRGIKTSGGKSYKSTRVTTGVVSRVTSQGANGWLEFTYGWSPLVADIRGIATNVLGSVRNYLLRFKGNANVVIKENAYVDGPSGHVGRCTIDGSVRVLYGVQMKPGFDSTLSTWTSLNPFSVAYELVPFSFVFDWILDLGGYMRNLETSLLYRNQFVSGYVSILTKYRSSSVFASSRKTGAGSSLELVGQCSYEAATFRRVITESYPSPQFPKIQADLGSSRLLSAASLLRQALTRRS